MLALSGTCGFTVRARNFELAMEGNGLATLELQILL